MPFPLRRLSSFAAFLVIALGVTAALTAPTTAHAQVKASLVAAETSIQPGRAFTVALRLEHEPHWHTYWINAGTGYPTSLTWELPPGWKAGEIEWPTPHVVKDGSGNIAGNGYENDTLLPVTITPPADLKPGETITLRAKAEWLMCASVCKPGTADVSLSLPISADKPKNNDATRALFAAVPTPAPADGFNLTATRSGKTISLTIAGPRAASLKNLHAFTSDALVQYDLPQTAKTSGDQVTLTLPVSPSYDGKADKLTGVLAYTNDTGATRGLILDVPITASTAAASTSASANGSSAAVKPTVSTGSFLSTLFFAFIGGLILNLMPCVFPVLGIKILGFVKQSGADHRKVTLHGLMFTAGVLISFWILGGLLVTVWKGTGWGTQLQHPEANFTIAAIFLIFGLSLSGVFEIGLSATRVGNATAGKSGLFATFLEGAFITIVATPCSAPFLGVVLGAALTSLPAAQAMVVFTSVALGLASPYLLLSIFPGGTKLLPRPGAWMETFKQFVAFPVYAAVGFFVWVLGGQNPGKEYTVLFAIFGLTIIALAAWLYGRYNAPGAKPARARLGLIGGLVLFAAGAALGWPRAAAPTDLVWEKWSPEAVAKAQAEGKTAYVDFTARWCFTCQTNKAAVFGSSDVKKLIRDKNIVLLKADWTNQDPQITAELAKYNRSAVPFNLIYKPTSPEPKILPELLTPGIVLDALKG